MSPRVPKAYLEARRWEVLEAALKCFAEKGYRNTTMRDIYRTTNLSPGAVYNYFSNKENIMISAVQEFQHWTVSSLSGLIADNPNVNLVEIIRYWLSILRRRDSNVHLRVQLDLYVEALSNPDIRAVILESHDATHAELIKVIKNEQQAGKLNARLDPPAIARAFMGLMFGIVIHKSLDPEVDLEAFGQVCEAIFTGTFYKSVNGPTRTSNSIKNNVSP